jgi:hypothetical protein
VLSVLMWILVLFKCIFCVHFFFLWRSCDPTRVMASSFLRFLDHTQRGTTVGRTPLDEWSARRRDEKEVSEVYLTLSIRKRLLPLSFFVLCFILGNFPASEFYMPTFRNTLSVPSDNTRHSQQINIHVPGGTGTHDLSRRAAADLRLRPRGH